MAKRKSAWEQAKSDVGKQWDRLVGNVTDVVKKTPTGYNAAKGRAHTVEDATDDLRKYKMRNNN